MKTSFSVRHKYIWDHWFLNENGGWFKYFLQAPSRYTEDERHEYAGVGCAFSDNLEDWKYYGEIFHADKNRWFNTSIWTGSVVKHEDNYDMFFTSRDSKEINEQKIGLLVADNPIFKNYRVLRKNRPLLTIDKKYYEVSSPDGMTHWRDPYIYEEKGNFFMLICARKNKGDVDGRGTVGLAVSKDLVNWEIQPPLDIPEWFGECECPYIYKRNNIYYLHFSAHKFSKKLINTKGERPVNGDYYLVSDKLRGPYKAAPAGPELFEDNTERIAYNSKVISKDDSSYVLFWAKKSAENVEKLTHVSPIKIAYLDDGSIKTDL